PRTSPVATASPAAHTSTSISRIRSRAGSRPRHTGAAPGIPASSRLPVSMGPAYVGETGAMTPTTETTVGIGGAAESTDMVLNIGPQHPSTHGVLRLRLVLAGERIVRAEPVIGYMHRGAEKLFEARDYRQIIVLANRHDWLSAFSNELGVV